ncbi:hydroxyethylthiazole kinase-like uncharacterized protein yjeF [Dysgonomonas sp. PH5-45]|uniref:NAD(P)H-hydrate dehydratase n=1 Tax=unclassified Dysgonomonas TaxID=2630389 RepID=UPI002475D2FC|nr:MULTISPECIES: NAD(P)H-hydrate dehydratase [unclassified Dysgonomonas]MDH6355408.1 hydroxyethylthiazole kinase-like uncharacterized protein yjeF [Dysgonomonas sp. PH5-45]MDH6388305.1 hydroxyethylthiazole kinase-like uncharacterized protein yjeF [Dysgonomonas sp. PH5-37]
MKILTGTQIKAADNYTIENEQINSFDLMERAANVIADWFKDNIGKDIPLFFFIGKGNNGGDGLAVARILYNTGYKCSVYTAYSKSDMTEECNHNMNLLPYGVDIIEGGQIEISKKTIIVDALLGSGLVGEVKEPLRSIINIINSLPNRIVSIDIPSGMICEFGNASQTIVNANQTLTLEFPKLAALLPEAGECCGEMIILPIGLSKDFMQQTESPYFFIVESTIQKLLRPRLKFAHKGTYGHALLLCGSEGMAGAAVLATGAALRSGCGLVTTHMPEQERMAVQVNYPSAILSLDKNTSLSSLTQDLTQYSAIGIGCGVGQSAQTTGVLEQLLKSDTGLPMVFDADAINILAQNKELLQYIPKGSVFTPHLGELKRLIGNWDDEAHKLKLVLEYAKDLDSVFVVKGAHTLVCMPDGQYFFNSTGNSGMAKGGCGDVLTGYLTGLMARGYSNTHAALIGVYLHGLAGDMAAQEYGQEAMNSKDIIDYLAKAMKVVTE